MSDAVAIGGLNINADLGRLVREQMIPGTGLDAEELWHTFANIVTEMGPRNRELLQRRDELQAKIDQWYMARRNQPLRSQETIDFLLKIGYLLPEGADFKVDPSNVDLEISDVAGPQLVVPVDNARYALNAANARWGSLYDALYGTDVIPESDGLEKGGEYNFRRGDAVIAYSQRFLDQAVPLSDGAFADVGNFSLNLVQGNQQLLITLRDGQAVGLTKPDQFVGYLENEGQLSHILLRNNGLHIEIQLDHTHFIGKTSPAGVKDIVLEAAVTTIQDCEDSVSAVDAADKLRVYANWHGILQGTLEETFYKNGKPSTRKLNSDKFYLAPSGKQFSLPGRSLLLVHNVGIHMYTDMVTTADGAAIPEGFLDALITALASVQDLQQTNRLRNSRAGSVYIVKPKLHGPEEVAFTADLFSRVEDALGLLRNTLKIGIMDEERRTTVNLKEAIRAAKDRVIFINTGFLDRTGDEIHTAMEAGPMLPKGEIKNQPWIRALRVESLWKSKKGMLLSFVNTPSPYSSKLALTAKRFACRIGSVYPFGSRRPFKINSNAAWNSKLCSKCGAIGR